ncbi:hypothetical protein [Desulfosporosinus metallidurans]|uniref:Uncharacterized protein n=1 Tax=Desulfosporosinus metallidurans TaxID=1888891 RepID=A0A1Q8QME8_9FIRM|nr:hypothetical protein [Desulfosporosinus metallidurans]OLN28438.1 hypothetical protein DSOL_4087 [Desulfosporosinus metallidurans]
MDNHEVIEQTLANYEAANDALLTIWEQLDPGTLCTQVKVNITPIF